MNNIYIDVPVQLNDIRNALFETPPKNVIVRFKNSITLTENKIKLLQSLSKNRIYIQIVGGYTQTRINNYPRYKDVYTTDNIYTLDESLQILSEMQKLEAGIKYEWDDAQRLFYIINYLKNHIIYHPFHEIQPSSEIRSLRGLVSKKTVCAGYALILKELCDRNGIECQYVEGCTKKEYYDKGILSHCWNIVKINGKYIPIDLTWSAGKQKRGEMLSNEDIGNVNEFIRNHIPGKYEKIQDYQKSLTSIDGKTIRNMNFLYSRDKEVTNLTLFGKRKDESRFVLVQAGQTVKDNQYVYTYIYHDIENGKLTPPIILYSTTNILGNAFATERKNKLIRQLHQSLITNRFKTAEEIKEILEKYKDCDQIDYLVSNVLLSKENINAAKQRKDYYLGNIYRKNNNKLSVKVDLDLAKKIDSRQKTYVRADGSSFVVEGCIKKGNFYRSIVNETVIKDKGICLLQNSIFTDYEFIKDNRNTVPNKFLSRTRLDHECKNNNGYLGYLDNLGNVNLIGSYLSYFTKCLYDKYTLREQDFKKYSPDITFDEMKRLIKTYELTINTNNEAVYRNRVTKEIVTNEELDLRIRFAYIWVRAAGTIVFSKEIYPGFSYAFTESTKDTFKKICSYINESMVMNGNIDPVSILDEAEKFSYKYAEDIVIKMFKTKDNVKVINKLFRLINPSTLEEKANIPSFGHDEAYPYAEVMKRRKNELNKMVLDVSKDTNDAIKISETLNRNLR